ncbi:hypothetical protein ACPV3S_13010 [Photobacterium damselae]|uniref:hypothetical protein n=1 Tax=Photobacterium damselae TaxID=38293 RepID=UPI004068FDD0
MSTNKKIPASPEQEAIIKRINELGTKNNEFGKPQYPYYVRRLLLAFAKFIDNPHAYNNKLHDLHYCQSRVGGLQRRQRINCVKQMVVLMSKMDVENYQLGFANKKEMTTITHEWFMARYEQFWQEFISLKRYYHTIHLFKMADFLTVDAVFIYDESLPVPKNEDSSINEDEAPRIYSKAAYKAITAKFIRIFGLDADEGVRKSKLKAIKKRVLNGLSNVWWVYEPFSDTYAWTKRQLANIIRRDSVTGKTKRRYPQGKSVEPDIYGGNYLTEH